MKVRTITQALSKIICIYNYRYGLNLRMGVDADLDEDEVISYIENILKDKNEIWETKTRIYFEKRAFGNIIKEEWFEINYVYDCEKIKKILEAFISVLEKNNK